MGGPRERAALAHFEEVFAEAIASAVVAQLRKEAAEQGVDVWTWLASQTTKDAGVGNSIAVAVKLADWAAPARTSR